MSQYFSFQWHITDECDQRCKHCYIFSGEGCKELKSMTWNQMTEVVASCEISARYMAEYHIFILLAEILSFIRIFGN